MLKFEEYKQEVMKDLAEVKMIEEETIEKTVRESYSLIVECIRKVIGDNIRLHDNSSDDDELLFTKYQVGFYLYLEDRKEGRIDGGNGYTGYTYSSYSQSIQSKVQSLIDNNVKNEDKKYKLTDDEDLYVENYYLLEGALTSSVDLFENDSTEEYIFKKEQTNMKKLFKVTSVGTVELTQEQLENFESGHIEDIVCLVRMKDGSTVTLKADIENEVDFSNLEE